MQTRGKYRAVIHLEAGLTSPDSKFIIRMRLSNKGSVFHILRRSLLFHEYYDRYLGNTCGRRRKNSPYPAGEAADRTQDFGNPRNEDGLWLSPCNYIRCRYDWLRTSYDATLSANQSQHYHCRLLASVLPRLEPVVWLAHLIGSVRCDWLKQLFKFRFHERLIKSSATVTNLVQITSLSFLFCRFLGTHTDVALEDLHIHGKIQLELLFNHSIPFPHLAAVRLCFTEK